MTLNDYLIFLSKSLQDYDGNRRFVRWSRLFLIETINEGMLIVSTFKPDKFIRTRVIKLDQGSIQTPQCEKVIKVFSQTDQYGNEIGGSLLKVSNNSIARWTKSNSCHKFNEFRLTSYTIEKDSESKFIVKPPVPPDIPVYVKISCLDYPYTYKENDLNKEIEPISALPALTQWVLYRAMIIDNQSRSAASVGQSHLELFFRLLKVQYARDFINQHKDLTSPELRSEITTLRNAGIVGSQV